MSVEGSKQVLSKCKHKLDERFEYECMNVSRRVQIYWIYLEEESGPNRFVLAFSLVYMTIQRDRFEDI